MTLADLIPLPSLLQLPEIPGKCSSNVNIQERGRLLGERQLKEAITSKITSGIINSKCPPSQDEFFDIISGIKWDFIKKDLSALANQIEILYRRRLDEMGFNLDHQPHSMLYQIVEISWTLREYPPSSSAIRYDIITKRDIGIR